jgi:SAM-dependent methyltransferase
MPLFSNVLHDTREQALDTERTAMQLDYCPRCGFIYNATFEPDRLRYGRGYENDLSVSPYFREYAAHLAAELVQRHNLKDKDIIEIGCGDGHFLRLICDMGANCGVGFDPSYDSQRISADRHGNRVTIVADVYSRQYRHRRADMICCRQVLEHIHDPLGFLRELRRTLDSWDGCVLFFEVPNAGQTFLHGAVWDILYEHCNYFTEQSLSRLFVAAGFQPLQIDERYDGQFLTIEARPASHAKGREADGAVEPVQRQNQLADFQELFHNIVDSWQTRMATWEEQSRRVVAWGAGTKGATFLNALGLFHDTFEYVVDIHPRKQGRFIPGTGQEIIPPESLARCQPDTIVVMNPAYAREIRDRARKYAHGVTFVTASSPYVLCP